MAADDPDTREAEFPDTLSYSLDETSRTVFAIDSDGVITVASDADLDHETTPSYSVTVTVTDGKATATHQLTIQVTDVEEAPSAPTVTVGAASATQLTVTWEPPENTGPAVNDYDVRYFQGAEGEEPADEADWIEASEAAGLTDPGTAETVTISGLTPETTYLVQVRASNDEGTGAWSASGSAATLSVENTAPSFPANAPTTLSVPENSPGGTVVGIVTATDENPLTYSLDDASDAVFDISDTGVITVASGAELDYETTPSYSVTVTASDGALSANHTVTILVGDEDEAPVPSDETEPRVTLAPAASHPWAQGFVRVVNHSGEAGEVSIVAIDDAGVEYGPVTLDLDAHETVHFNSGDLEAGNPRKGLSDGVGPGEGDWRLELASALDLEVLSYIRTDDGFVTSMHDVAPVDEAGGYRVVFFNPGSNRNQVSLLRLTNLGGEAVEVRIAGTDDAGEGGESEVVLTLGAGASRTLGAQELESGQGEDLSGALGDGKGKWRLRVSAEGPIRVMSLLQSPTGHLTNLSATPREGATGGVAMSHRVPLAPSASDRLGRQGFVRVVNHSGEAGEVSIVAIDDAGVEYGPVTLDLEAHETAHFNSGDLEAGNARKGLASGVGPGEGDWRLELASALDLEVLSYIRTADGFVTSMHDVVPEDEAESYRVVFFNPASNRNQVSWLRLNNPGEAAVDVTIEGTDDAGEGGESGVELTLEAGASRMLSARALESGQDEGLRGRLGDGKGKWRLRVSAEEGPIRVMSLLVSPTGHLTNLSAAPGRP